MECSSSFLRTELKLHEQLVAEWYDVTAMYLWFHFQTEGFGESVLFFIGLKESKVLQLSPRHLMSPKYWRWKSQFGTGANCSFSSPRKLRTCTHQGYRILCFKRNKHAYSNCRQYLYKGQTILVDCEYCNFRLVRSMFKMLDNCR